MNDGVAWWSKLSRSEQDQWLERAKGSGFGNTLFSINDVYGLYQQVQREAAAATGKQTYDDAVGAVDIYEELSKP